MATSNGSWVTLATYNRGRAELVASVSYPGGSLTADDTSCTVSWTLRVRKHPDDTSGSSFNDTFDWALSGDHAASGAASLTLSGPGDLETVASGTATVSLTYSTQSWDVSASVDPRVLSGVMTVSHGEPIPARPYYVPAAQTGLTLTYVSDSRIDLAWTRNATTSAPYESQQIARWDHVTNDWYTVATLSGTATSFADTTTRADRIYRYAIRASNSSGSSLYNFDTPPEMRTRPATPSAPTAKKNSGGGIVVYRPTLSQVAQEWDVQHVVNGVDPGPLVATISAGVGSWTFAAPDPASTHAFRIRTRSATAGGGLASSWSPLSNTVQLVAPPAAPTGLGPTGAADATEALTRYWTHNPVDTTPQSAYEVTQRSSTDGGATWTAWTATGKVTSTGSTRTDAAGTWANGTLIEWQVRTWGEHADPGTWSGVRAFRFSARPVVGIVAPGPVHNASLVTAAWTFHDTEATAQARWEARLLSGGEVLESLSGYDDATEVAFGTRVDDGGSYTVEVEGRDGHGVWSLVAAQAFTVDYALPPTPTLSAEWQADDGYTVLSVDAPTLPPAWAASTAYSLGQQVVLTSGATLQVSVAGTSGTIEPAAPAAIGGTVVDGTVTWARVESLVELTSIAVHRASPEGWVLVADGLGRGATVTDMIPPAGTVVTYRAVAVSDLPSEAYSTAAVVDTATGWLFLNYGPNFGSVVRVRSNVVAGRGGGTEKVRHHFSGRPDPVEFSGTARTRTFSVSASMWADWTSVKDNDGQSTYDELLAVSDAPAPVCVRDPKGMRLFVSTDPLDESGLYEAQSRVSLPMVQVHWSEPVA